MVSNIQIPEKNETEATVVCFNKPLPIGAPTP